MSLPSDTKLCRNRTNCTNNIQVLTNAGAGFHAVRKMLTYVGSVYIKIENMLLSQKQPVYRRMTATVFFFFFFFFFVIKMPLKNVIVLSVYSFTVYFLYHMTVMLFSEITHVIKII